MVDSQLIDGLLEDASHFELRFIPDYAQLSHVVSALRDGGHKIVLTSGSFDILHEGHSMYLEAARGLGDFLIVGVDDDAKIRERKGIHRPVVPEAERLRMVVHQRGVGIVTLKTLQHPRWALVRAVQPDVLVATEDTYTDEEIAELESGYCGRVEVLSRMATISTSARLRRVHLEMAENLASEMSERVPVLMHEMSERIPVLMKEIIQELVSCRGS